MGALASGVSGLKAHQTMLDIAGNNLANVNTMAFKASTVNFSDTLSQTFRAASPPPTGSSTIGGTNPMQIGSGVQVASVDRDMRQGTMKDTGQELDMAIEGSGYFTLNDGQEDVYTRVGLFDVDADNNLVDSDTGYMVQRHGTVGESDGFQIPGFYGIKIPYNTLLKANETSNIVFTGTLSSNLVSATTNNLLSTLKFTNNGTAAALTDSLDSLDQYTNADVADTISITGTNRAGTTVSTSFSTYSGAAYLTVGDLVTAITAAFGGSAISTASLDDGKIRLLDTDNGYSQTDLYLGFTSGGGSSAFTTPKHFEGMQIGGEMSVTTSISMFDSLGEEHVGRVTFVRTDAGTNTWDMVLNTLDGEVELVDRRIMGLNFLADGSYNGIAGASTLQVRFSNDPTNTRTITLDLGTVGSPGGINLSSGSSSVAVTSQDGYRDGVLSSISISQEGMITGKFTNEILRDLAALKITTFVNPGGLEAIGNNYFTVTGNSGAAVSGSGLSGSAGAVRGGSLEESNVEIAGEFVSLIEAQNGYQANARTIRVANDMLKELTNLIR